MHTRNVVLLIIVLIIITLGVFAFMYFRQPDIEIREEEGTNFIASFWPFGKDETKTPVETETPSDVSGYEPEEEIQDTTIKLKKISSMPVAGYGVFMKERYGETEKELIPYVRYADRIYGNTYQTFADNIDERKFSSTIIPTLHEVFFGNGGESLIMRYLKEDGKTIETFAGSLPKEVLGGDTTKENELTGSYLPENISFVSISPNSSKLFYLFPIGEEIIGTTAGMDGENKIQVFDSAFTEWIPDWANDRMISLTTKPSAGVLGYMYAVDPLTKEFTKILGDVNGLTTLTSPSGKLILYSDNNLSLNIFNRTTRETKGMAVRTLPEKCVWSNTADIIYCAVPKFVGSSFFPDTWYQGETSFSDEIWKIDAVNGNSTQLADPSTIGTMEEIDAVNLQIDDTEKYIFFVNKKDSYLWMLEL